MQVCLCVLVASVRSLMKNFCLQKKGIYICVCVWWCVWCIGGLGDADVFLCIGCFSEITNEELLPAEEGYLYMCVCVCVCVCVRVRECVHAHVCFHQGPCREA